MKVGVDLGTWRHDVATIENTSHDITYTPTHTHAQTQGEARATPVCCRVALYATVRDNNSVLLFTSNRVAVPTNISPPLHIEDCH